MNTQELVEAATQLSRRFVGINILSFSSAHGVFRMFQDGFVTLKATQLTNEKWILHDVLDRVRPTLKRAGLCEEQPLTGRDILAATQMILFEEDLMLLRLPHTFFERWLERCPDAQEKA